MRVCRTCLVEKPLSKFDNGRRRQCTPCRVKARDPKREAANRRRVTLRKYNLTPEKYDEMLLAQEGLCGICKQPQTGKSLAVDHDHETGKIRGLLCFRCNALLGSAGDNPHLLKSAMEYLVGKEVPI